MTVDDEKIDTPVTNLYKLQNCYRDSPESGVSFKNGGGYLKVGELTSAFSRAARIFLIPLTLRKKMLLRGHVTATLLS